MEINSVSYTNVPVCCTAHKKRAAKRGCKVSKKVITIAERLSKVMTRWSGVETVLLGEAADIETLDPYFHINLDVYYHGAIPPSNDRRDAFGRPSAFETSPIYPVDCFLEDELPVAVTFNEVSRLSFILDRVRNHLWVLRSDGTYMFYRIQTGRILYKQSDWIEQIRSSLTGVFEGFWDQILDASRRSLEGCLRELGAAAFGGDSLSLIISTAGFVKSLCTFVFAMNRQFEPSSHAVLGKMKQLKRLPDGFLGRLETLLRQDEEITPGKKKEIAELLTKSLISMV